VRAAIPVLEELGQLLGSKQQLRECELPDDLVLNPLVVWDLLGRCLYDMGLFDRAADALFRAAKLDPNNRVTLQRLFTVHDHLGGTTEILRQLEEVHRLGSEDLLLLMRIAKNRKKAVPLVRALEMLDHILTIDPVHAEAWYYKTSWNIERKAWDEAKRCLDIARSKGVASDELERLDLAVAMETGKYALALDKLKKLSNHFPEEQREAMEKKIKALAENRA
jgi:tetratricopeptide (TPR) repeat protein